MRRRGLPLIRSVLVMAAALLASGCAPQSSSASRADEVIAWRTLGSWSGRGSAQTESFIFETGILRVRWQTKNAGSADGTFRLVLQSAVSGRALAVAADHHGPGNGESYIPEDPRSAYMLVESEDLDWSFTVEEGATGIVRESAMLAAPSSSRSW